MEQEIITYVTKKLKDARFGQGNLLAFQIIIKMCIVWVSENNTKDQIFKKIDLMCNGKDIGSESSELIYETLK